MFGVITGLARAVVKTAVLPVTLVADTVTLGGELSGERKSYTGRMLESIGEDIKDMAD